MGLSLSDVPDVGSRTARLQIRRTQPTIVVKTASRQTLPGESDALDLDAIAVAELQSAAGAGRRVGREELVPNPVQFVVIRAVGQDDGDLDDAVEAGSGGF